VLVKPKDVASGQWRKAYPITKDAFGQVFKRTTLRD
jgi:hypothetical protein